MSDEKPQGKTMRELRAIVAADAERWDRLHDVWLGLTADEQERLIAEAQRIVEGEA